MLPALIGIFSGLMIIVFVRILVRLLKPLDEKILYGLILAGIGFLYVGFTWTDWQALITNLVQAVVFVLIAGYGIIKNNLILAFGYILHGSWDLVYHFIHLPDLLPPQYDLFCSLLDFILAAYLLIAGRVWMRQFIKKKKIQDSNCKDRFSVEVIP